MLNQPIENTRLLQVLGLQQSCCRIFMILPGRGVRSGLFYAL